MSRIKGEACMEFQMNYFVTSDQATLSYFDIGEGQPIVLIAGYGGNAKSWFNQVEALLAYGGFRVIGFDRRNHGASQNVTYGQHIARHGEDLHDLIELLKLEKPILIGHSQGMSAIYAYIMLHGSENVRAIMSIDQTPKMINDKSWKYGMYDVTYDNFDETLARDLPEATFKEIDIVLREKIAHYKKQDHQFDYIVTKPLLFNHFFENWLDVLPQITVPILFVGCEHSAYWSHQHAQECAKRVKTGHSYIFETSGHLPQLEEPVEFNKMLLAFVDQYVGA